MDLHFFIESLSKDLADRLEPVQLLSDGPGGVVMLCRDRSSAVPCVLKHSGLASRTDATINARFVREARILADLKIGGVVRVIEAGEDKGARYLVMEHLEGPNLEDRVQSSGPIPVLRALEITLLLAQALEALHDTGVLHRDVKPANVLLCPGRGPVLIDFGLVRTLMDSQTLTASGDLVGTPAYVAPEIVRGSQPGAPSDIYSLGLVMHFLLTGRHTFARRTTFGSLEAQLEDAPSPVPQLDAPLNAVLMSCLAKDPALRPGSTNQRLSDQLALQRQRLRS